MTLEQLAKYLGLRSTGSLRKQIARKALKAVRIGHRTFVVSRDEAERYRAENLAGPGKRGRPPGAKLHDDREDGGVNNPQE